MLSGFQFVTSILGLLNSKVTEIG